MKVIGACQGETACIRNLECKEYLSDKTKLNVIQGVRFSSRIVQIQWHGGGGEGGGVNVTNSNVGERLD